jgi:4-aminobutyrate aminotransferase-like enzyme
MNNSFNPANAAGLDEHTKSLVERRQRLLGPAYRLFYNTPVEFVRGQGVKLWDADGNEYLDAYNNVVSVGHAHPRVSEAVAKQMETLCTHTRYLQEGILNYAEQLLATYGGSMSAEGHTMFTCTGSEANDLAIRIAQHHTGKRGIIVTQEAYHGNSFLTAGFSPSLGEHSPLGTFVRQVPAPDTYRIPKDQIADYFADQVSLQIKDLERHGDGLAAFVVDSLFSSDGIYSEPADMMKKVIDVVHDAGGVFVADEVQCGFGRGGDSMWGYQRYGLDPDIVTMGKPMGNGYPVAGIAVKHHILESFAYDSRYFNTFGGNTVAMAAAQAVLDVIQEEKIVENAHQVGAFLKAGLNELAKSFDVIGDVRGSGLYYGVELVTDRTAKTPDAPSTAKVVNGLRERRVLISTTGAAANTLKIRPPLVFSKENATQLLTELEATLKSI